MIISSFCICLLSLRPKFGICCCLRVQILLSNSECSIPEQKNGLFTPQSPRNLWQNSTIFARYPLVCTRRNIIILSNYMTQSSHRMKTYLNYAQGSIALGALLERMKQLENSSETQETRNDCCFSFIKPSLLYIRLQGSVCKHMAYFRAQELKWHQLSWFITSFPLQITFLILLG